jgi:hypothetical protein
LIPLSLSPFSVVLVIFHRRDEKRVRFSSQERKSSGHILMQIECNYILIPSIHSCFFKKYL